MLFVKMTIDINECEMETDNCDGNANCTDTIGSFNCTCNPGYDGDGVNCASEFFSLTDNSFWTLELMLFVVLFWS